MKYYTLSILAVFSSIIILYSQAPSNIVATPSITTIAKLDKFELTITLTAGYTNPYDYDDIAVRAEFIAPGGRKDTVDAFFMQDYTLNTTNGSITANGAPVFRVRYSPNETGNWQYTVFAKNLSGTGTGATQNFQCTASSARGFIKRNTSNYLGFDNNEQFIPVGQNQAWHQNNIYLDYKAWLQKLADNKANAIRIWQAVWGFGIEWKTGVDGYTGLKRYRQTSSYYTDWLLDECKSKGIYVMLCINHHGMVSSNVNPNWPESPYNAVNGGPCPNTWDFFTNTTAKNLHKNRLRYIVARWGYSQNIMTWELFNEVDWTDNFTTHRTSVKDWHLEMAAYLKSLDVYKHLVSTSYANNSYDPDIWNSPLIDFAQTHNYIGSPNIESALAAVSGDYVTQYNKPTLNGEYGIDANASSLSTIDPNGIHIHNSIWATSFGGAMGAGMTWWWDNYIHPQDLYRHYKPLSEFIATIALKDGNYKKNVSSSSGGGTSDIVLTPGVGFGLAGASSFTIDATGTVTPSAAQLSNYLFGSSFNTQHRSPPTFSVNYPVAGQFRVNTGTSVAAAGARITIYLDGSATPALDQVAAINSSYNINISPGAHTIKVDNLGTDWVSISNYTFTNIGSALNTYMVKNSDSSRVSGWIHNKKYNWQFVKDNGNPPAVTNATLSVPGMRNGNYTVHLFDCNTGASISTVTGIATGNNLVIALPSVSWDLAMTATWVDFVTGIVDLTTAKDLKVYPNPLVQDVLYISYDLTKLSQVNIDLVDIRGNKVAEVFSGKQPAGKYLIDWNATKLAMGVYFLRFAIGNERKVEKIVINK